MVSTPHLQFCPHQAGYRSDTLAPHCFPQGPDGAGELGPEACTVHALFLILHSGNILDSGPGDANSKQADVQTLSLAFEAVTRIHFPEALGHVALRLVPCPPICAAAYALVSKYWSGVGGRGSSVADSLGLQGPKRPHEERGRRPGSQAPGPVTHPAGPQFRSRAPSQRPHGARTCQQARGTWRGQQRGWRPSHPPATPPPTA